MKKFKQIYLDRNKQYKHYIHNKALSFHSNIFLALSFGYLANVQETRAKFLVFPQFSTILLNFVQLRNLLFIIIFLLYIHFLGNVFYVSFLPRCLFFIALKAKSRYLKASHGFTSRTTIRNEFMLAVLFYVLPFRQKALQFDKLVLELPAFFPRFSDFPQKFPQEIMKFVR